MSITANQITFAINGQRYDVDPAKYDLTLTLNGFIRRHTPYKGTKLSCGEGGCGACVVDLSRTQGKEGSHSNKDSSLVHASVNSCIRPLASMDGWAVTTTEGLRKGQDFHPIQQRIADFNGSQCGFCTPGMVMTLYSSLLEKPQSTMAELEDRYDGNICRCTGFRPILDAVKSFATDSNVANQVNRLPFTSGPYDHSQYDPVFPAFLHSVDTTRRLEFQDANGRTWTRPSNLTEALQLSSKIGDMSTIKYVNAGTSIGYVKSEPRTVQHFIDISNLSELHQIKTNDFGVTIGGSTTVTNFIKHLRSQATSQPADKVRSFNALADHAYRVASVHVRNVGTVAGNLILAKNHGFTSDLAVILLGANATVTWASLKGDKLVSETESIEQFLAKPQQSSEHRIIQAISVPWTNGNTFYRTFKAAPRPQQALALIHAAMNVQVDQAGLVVGEPVIVFGAIMGMDEAGSHPVRAKRAEAALKGKNAKERGTLDAAIAGVIHDFAEHVGGGSGGGGEDIRRIQFHGPGGEADRKYRSRVAVGFLYKYLVALSASLHNETNLGLQKSVSAVQDPAHRDVTTSSQIFQEVGTDSEKKESVVHKAIPHIASRLQAAGDAVYTDDIKEIKGTLFARFITAEKCRVKLGSLNTEEALKMKGVVGVFTAADIQGFNNVAAFPPATQTLFAEQGKDLSYLGEIIGIVVAETEKIAKEAVRRIKINYEGEAKAPVITIQAALKEPETFHISRIKEVMKQGDAEAVFKQAAEKKLPEGSHYLKGNIDVGTQHHFYMETQCAYVVPDENKGLKVYAPVQWPDGAQIVVSQVCGLPIKNVQIIHRRSGGGFGGKSFHPIVVAASCGVAAYKLNKPIRMALDREEDFAIFGGREETYGDYEVVADKEGRINAVKFTGYLNCGYSEGFGGMICKAVLGSLTEGYDVTNFDGWMSLCKSNTAARTPCRGPGETQASYIIENIIDHVAHETGISPDTVRERNFYGTKHQGILQDLGLKDYKSPNGTPIENYSIPELWQRVKEKSGYDQRRAAVDKFNQENRWKKRGLSTTTVRYEVTQLPRTVVLNIYGDGSIIVIHGGVEMGQGLNTKTAQTTAGTLLNIFDNPTEALSREIFDSVKMGDVDTNVIPNAIFTGGSTGSEGTAEAAKMAAEEMGKRLKPVLTTLLQKRKEQSGDSSNTTTTTTVTWVELCGAAKQQGIDLQVQSYYDAGGKFNIMGGTHYDNFGVATSEVEVDIITGEVSIRSVDLVYDCGKSLNPAIDIGQCEGAFMMGVGHWLREHVEWDAATGRHETNSTFAYHPPCVKDVPARWNVELLADSRFNKGVLSSKASGEPPLVLATSVVMAVKEAVKSARKDAGITEFFVFKAPLTAESIVEVAGTKESLFVF